MMKQMRKMKQGVAVMLAALMTVTMLPQNSMQTFAAETATVESPETDSDYNGSSTEQEAAAAVDESAGEGAEDGNESGQEEAAGEDKFGQEEAAGEDESGQEDTSGDDGSGQEEDKDRDDESGEETTEGDDWEETADPEGISENTIDETVTLFGTENEANSTSSAADFVISNGVLTGYTGTATDLVIPSGVTAIGNNFLKNNTTVTSVTFSAGVMSVGDYAFSGCTSLGKVELNEGLITIGNDAFSKTGFGEELSTGLVKGYHLTIPSTVRSIGVGAFYNCEYLEEVVFAEGETDVLTMGGSYYGVFGECANLKRVVLPGRLKELPECAFMNSGRLEELVLKEGLEAIGNKVCSECKSLKGITFPATVKSVGDRAFQNCKSLGSAVLNEGLITIGNDVFSGAGFGEKLSTGAVKGYHLTVPSTVRSIGVGAFYNCEYLEEVVFAEGETAVLTMGGSYYGVFGECANLKRVVLPGRLKELPECAFMNNGRLESVYIPETVTTINKKALLNCPKLVIYGTPGTEAERYAKANKIPFKSKTELKLSVESVSLNRSIITKVGEAAMGQTVQLTATVLPESAQNKSVAWTSSDSSVAAVDGSGLVTITGCGKATITVTTNDGNKQASCAVTVLRQWTQAELDEIKTALQTQNDSGWTVVTNRLTDIRDLEIKVPAGAQYTAEWKLDYAVDTGANNHYDIRIRQEGYQDAVLRGFTVTGVTLEGLTVSAPNQVMKVETGKELTLTAEPSISGLTGDITAADLYKVEWKSANPSALSIGTVSQVSDITPAQAHVKGVKKASNVAVTATLVLLDQDQVPYAKDKNKKGRTWFETTVKISVLTQSVTDQIVITALDRQEQPVELSSLRELLMSEQETVYHLKAEVSAGGTPVASPKLTWKSSNTALATVTGSDAAVTLKIKGKQKGTAVISATAAKDSGHVEKFRVVVKDSKPRLEETNLTFNLYKETLQETVHLLPSDGYQVKSESLKILNNDKGKTDSAFFEIRKDEENENSYRISVKAGKEPKTGRQKLLLSVTTSAEEQEPHQIPFTVQVVKAAPKLTIKQEAVDLYRKGAQGTVHLTSSEEIEDIQYVSTTGDASARLVQKTKDVTEGVFTFGLENATAANYKKAGAKGKLLVTFKGYSEEASYNKALTLSVNKKLPVVKAVAEHGVLYPETPLDSTKIRFRDKDGNALPGSISVERDGNAPKKTEITIEDQQQSYDVQVKVLKGAAGRITTKWKVRAADWYEPVKVSCAIQTQKKTALSFENSTLNLSTFYNLEQYEPASTGMILKGFEDREIVSTTVSGADKKSVEAQKALVFGQEDNRLTVGIADADFFKKAGTYQYMVKARFADSRTVEGKIKIAVKKAAASASLKAKGSIDLLNRQGTEIVYTAALKNYTDRVAAVNLYGECAGSFRCTYSEEDGKIHLRAKEGAFLKQKTPYKLKVCLTLGSGVELVAPVTVKLQQKAVKLQKSTETVTLFESVNQSACTKKIDFSVKDHVNGVEISSVTLVNNFDTFSYRHDGEGAGKIWVSEIPSGKVNKKYTLKFAVTFKDGATNAAPAYVTVKVDYRK